MPSSISKDKGGPPGTSNQGKMSMGEANGSEGEVSWGKIRPCKYPIEQPDPYTREHDHDWDREIQSLGPIGLLIESIVWSGLVIDAEFRIL